MAAKKRKAGRPRLPASKKKPDLTISVRTSPERLLKWAVAANKAKAPLRTWIGQVCDEAAK